MTAWQRIFSLCRLKSGTEIWFPENSSYLRTRMRDHSALTTLPQPPFPESCCRTQILRVPHCVFPRPNLILKRKGWKAMKPLPVPFAAITSSACRSTSHPRDRMASQVPRTLDQPLTEHMKQILLQNILSKMIAFLMLNCDAQATIYGWDSSYI